MLNFGPEKKPDGSGQEPGGRPASNSARDAINKWETEGGRAPDAPPPRAEVAPAEEAVVDEVRTELMAQESPDGRPPPAGTRRWEWAALGGATLAAILAAWGLLAAQPRSAPWLIAWGLVLLVTVPVWGAALLRGREERRAAREAKAVVKDEGSRATPGRDATRTTDRDPADRSRSDQGEMRRRPGG